MKYTKLYLKLLPRGFAWNKEQDSNTYKLFNGFSFIMQAIHMRALDLITESDPRTTSELLPDFERNLGLPDPCFEGDQSFQSRRRAVVRKMREDNYFNIPYIIALAAELGFDVDVNEFFPRRYCDPYEGTYNAEVDAHVFQITVKSGGEVAEVREYGNLYCERYELYETNPLECLLAKQKPVHTTVIFEYL